MAARSNSSPTMSSDRTSASPEQKSFQGREKIVTDSIHQRMKPPQVFCEICKCHIAGTFLEIKKHFKPTHKSIVTCHSCNGKVFSYVETKYDVDGCPTMEEHNFHDCPNKAKPRDENSNS